MYLAILKKNETSDPNMLHFQIICKIIFSLIVYVCYFLEMIILNLQVVYLDKINSFLTGSGYNENCNKCTSPDVLACCQYKIRQRKLLSVTFFMKKNAHDFKEGITFYILLMLKSASDISFFRNRHLKRITP